MLTHCTRGHPHAMVADWNCIFRKVRAGREGQVNPHHDGVGESIISAVGLNPTVDPSNFLAFDFKGIGVF
jgi:hypothetical protein